MKEQRASLKEEWVYKMWEDEIHVGVKDEKSIQGIQVSVRELRVGIREGVEDMRRNKAGIKGEKE